MMVSSISSSAADGVLAAEYAQRHVSALGVRLASRSAQPTHHRGVSQYTRQDSERRRTALARVLPLLRRVVSTTEEHQSATCLHRTHRPFASEHCRRERSFATTSLHGHNR